ncbi:hypothetical protein IW261DRAFT_1527274, partial [Armillaria novae-zelandiae]
MDGVWNIPDGFMLIYVCPLNPRERPAIHKNLVSSAQPSPPSPPIHLTLPSHS